MWLLSLCKSLLSILMSSLTYWISVLYLPGFASSPPILVVTCLYLSSMKSILVFKRLKRDWNFSFSYPVTSSLFSIITYCCEGSGWSICCNCTRGSTFLGPATFFARLRIAIWSCKPFNSLVIASIASCLLTAFSSTLVTLVSARCCCICKKSLLS